MLLDRIQKILRDDDRSNPFVDNRPGATWFLSYSSNDIQKLHWNTPNQSVKADVLVLKAVSENGSDDRADHTANVIQAELSLLSEDQQYAHTCETRECTELLFDGHTI